MSDDGRVSVSGGSVRVRDSGSDGSDGTETEERRGGGDPSASTGDGRRMAHRHGASHALATLVTSIASGLLVWLFGRRLGVLADLVEGVGALVVSMFGLPFGAQTGSVVVLATLLSAVWGVGFHYAHR
jgi:hypothetical protein